MTISTPIQRITVSLPVKSGIVQDRPQFDLHYFNPATPTSTDYDNAKNAIMDFFNSTATGATQALNLYLSKSLDTGSNGVEINFYQLPTSPGNAGAPVATRTGTLSAVGTGELPEEVAVCVSWHAPYGTDPEFGPGRTTRPRARKRNRIYFGPCSGALLSNDPTTFRTIVSPTFTDNATKAFHMYLYTAMAANNWNLVAFSKTVWNGYLMTTGGVIWVDDAFDVQRRRGPAALARASITL